MATNGSCHTSSEELWRHSSPESTQIHDFMQKSAEKYGLPLKSYQDLWQWSVSEPAKFWEHVWEYTGVKAHEPYNHVSRCGVFSDDASSIPLGPITSVSDCRIGPENGRLSLSAAKFLRGQQAQLRRKSTLPVECPR